MKNEPVFVCKRIFDIQWENEAIGIEMWYKHWTVNVSCAKPVTILYCTCDTQEKVRITEMHGSENKSEKEIEANTLYENKKVDSCLKYTHKHICGKIIIMWNIKGRGYDECD